MRNEKSNRFISFKCQGSTDTSLSFAPIGLCRRTVKVSGIYLVAYGRDSLEQGDTCLGEGIEKMVTTVTWGIDTNITMVVRMYDPDLSFSGLYLHPVDIGEVAFELRILE